MGACRWERQSTPRPISSLDSCSHCGFSSKPADDEPKSRCSGHRGGPQASGAELCVAARGHAGHLLDTLESLPILESLGRPLGHVAPGLLRELPAQVFTTWCSGKGIQLSPGGYVSPYVEEVALCPLYILWRKYTEGIELNESQLAESY